MALGAQALPLVGVDVEVGAPVHQCDAVIEFRPDAHAWWLACKAQLAQWLQSSIVLTDAQQATTSDASDAHRARAPSENAATADERCQHHQR